MDCYATNGGSLGVAHSDDYPLPSLFEDSGTSSDDGIDLWTSTININGCDASTNAMRISNLNVEDGSTSEQDCNDHPESPRSSSNIRYSILKGAPPRREPKLEKNDDVEQAENPPSGTQPGGTTRAGFTLQESTTPCNSDDVPHDHYECVTHDDGEEREVRVGWKGHATRWKKGSVLRYTICAETFESPRWAALVAREVAKATSMWQNVGVRFQAVDRDEKATFAIKYCCEPDNRRPGVYARAFFPKTSAGELFVYQFALESSNIGYLANILAHELGHILGLSHEFAVEASFLWGKENVRSVMNYFDDLNQLQVGQQDREELAAYYECKEGQYEGLSITDIEPCLHRFFRNDNTVADAIDRPRPRRLYLHYRSKHVRFRRSHR
jgi:hypothetical protein